MEKSAYDIFAQDSSFAEIVEKLNVLFTPGDALNYLEPEYTASRTWESFTATESNAPVAQIVAFNAEAPLLTRETIGQASGNLPSVKIGMQMSAETLRKYLEAKQNPKISGGKLLKILFDDPVRVSNSMRSRFDLMFFEGLSKGVITASETTDKNGASSANELSIGMKTNQFFKTKARWVNSDGTTNVTATPLTDLQKVMDDFYREKAIMPTSIKMTSFLFRHMVKTTEVKNRFTGIELGEGARTVKMNVGTPKLTDINDLLNEEGLPPIVLVDRPVSKEIYVKNTKTGMFERKVETVSAFDKYNVTFSTTNNYGRLVWTFVNEMLAPSPNKTYATIDDYILLKRWSDGSSEWTEGEAIAIPVFDAASEMCIINTNTAY